MKTHEQKEVLRAVRKLISDVERETWRDEIEKKYLEKNPDCSGFSLATLVGAELEKKMAAKNKPLIKH